MSLNAPTISSDRRLLRLALLGLAAVALLARIPSIAEPLGIDQSLWASAARGIARGQLLYRDVWEQRPPGIYAAYVAAFRVFGWTPAAVAWLDILASTLTTALLYAIVRRLANGTTGAIAAALYATLTMPAWLYRHAGFLERSVCETFIVASVALAALCAVIWRDRQMVTAAFGVGLFAGLAVVFKPNAGLYLPALLIWMACNRPKDGFESLGSLVPSFFAAAIGATIVPALTLAWLWRLGLLPDARIAVVDFNRFYVATGFTLGGYAVDFSKAVWLRMKTDPLWLCGGVGSVVAIWEIARKRRLSPLAGLAVLWGGAAALVIVVNGARLFNTYFIQAFAPLAVLSAWVLTDGSRGHIVRRLVGVTAAVMMAFVLLQRHYPAKVMEWLRADVGALRGLDRTAYLERFGGYGNDRGYSARANDELASYLRAHTDYADRIFLFGINGAGVYFLADRLTAHRFLRVNFFVPAEFPDPHFRLDAVVDDLAASRPRYLIFERLHSASDMGKAVDALQADPEIVRLLSAYRLETTIEDFTLYRLIDDGAPAQPGRGDAGPR